MSKVYLPCVVWCKPCLSPPLDRPSPSRCVSNPFSVIIPYMFSKILILNIPIP